MISLLKVYLTAILLCFFLPLLKAQEMVNIKNNTIEHFFRYGEVSYLEDRSGVMNFDEIRLQDKLGRFKPNEGYYPINFSRPSAYWYKVKVNFPSGLTGKLGLIEFFDQTTDEITAYFPDAQGNYKREDAGAKTRFENRLYQHKNFEFTITNQSEGPHILYFRLKSANHVNVIIVYRTLERFIHYALLEYISFGLFYGMILVFCLYNLLMFFATRLKEYVYYVLFIFSVGVYEMSADGIAFQFIWPHLPELNNYAYGTALYCMSIFALIFTKILLQVKKRNPTFYFIIQLTIVIRTVYFAICLFAKNEWFIYKFLEFIPLSVAFLTAAVIWYQGFKPARFFVLAHAFLFVGAIIKLIAVLGFAEGWPGAVSHYSISFGFIMEMVLLSFSISDQVRLLRKERDKAKDEALKHIELNVVLQKSLNEELEEQVAERTRELTIQSEKIREQAEYISRINILLEEDNVKLKSNIEKITDARIESIELTFDEFKQKYPDRDQCYRLLSDIKWKDGFECRKCAGTNYSIGRRPFSRRCKKCFYEESPMQDTIFENNRIPINKAFYIVYLMFSTQGKISSYQLAEKVGIRQSTCWAYAIRIKHILEQQKPHPKNRKSSWIDLVMKHEQNTSSKTDG
ncbi:7TM diverse intracellular signaling domain-containing protein [Pedobacter sp. UBA5917]|jgi:hypothetical protein|uniref:7TM diverse intracellular signaling domain-containing protein n=1 Tax=Pedobacter sp. UBA5917 TaxID=1947061 RepID=UPI0025EDB0BC|nr:7TM diverse intracellular signaling domain-containing protein [Pedobacter sp. UBA5917]